MKYKVPFKFNRIPKKSTRFKYWMENLSWSGSLTEWNALTDEKRAEIRGEGV